MPKNLAHVGGLCSILLAVSYIVIGATFIFLPAEQQAGETVSFMASYPGNPWPFTILIWAFALGALPAFCAIPAISSLVEEGNEGWTRLASGIALLGFTAAAISYFYMIVTTPQRVEAYLAGDDMVKTAIVTTQNLIHLDYHGWLKFGGPGVWSIVMGILGLRTGRIPKGLSIVALAGGVLYAVTVAGESTHTMTLTLVGAGLGGCVIAPVFYVWSGVVLLKR